ncbi:MAG: TetR/AcrR family transcriptional regulator [Streptosporangiaceae bacterium]|jgi:AcrR family transcriptional regulator|nr:TetR family transcriptional regulator [Actinomycetota bacterium]
MTPTARHTASAAGRDAASPVRERLLSVATRLFAQNGFEATSVQQVVEAAGVTKGALYHYYDSKDDLLYEVYHRLLTMQRARLDEIASGPGGPAERLEAAAADVLRTTFENMDDMIVFFRSLHLLPAARQALIRTERRSYHKRFRQLVDEGIAAGAFRADVPADIVVQYFLSAINQLGTWYRPDGPLSPDQIGRYFTGLLMTGLQGS